MRAAGTQGVPVSLGLKHGVHGKVAAATGLVDDKEGLPQFLREHGRHLPGEQVVDGSGSGMADNGHGAFRPGRFRGQQAFLFMRR